MNFFDQLALATEQRSDNIWNDKFESASETDESNDIIEENEYFVIRQGCADLDPTF